MIRGRILRRRRTVTWLAAAAAALPLGAWLAFEIWLALLPMPSLARASDLSPVVLAEDGRILTAHLATDGAWRLRARLDDLPKPYLDMLLRYEDRRFFSHGGVDPLAVLRAIRQLIENRRVMSGASTITMQTVRLLGGQGPGLAGKLRQAALAIKLERSLDKREILELYLTLAPYGGNIEGVRMAALQYFGKEPNRLTIGEAALLIALPQLPERRRPDLDADAAREARDRVLSRMEQHSVFAPAAVAAARAEAVPKERGKYRFLARHLGDRLIGEEPEKRDIPTFIDRHLQAGVEEMVGALVAQQPDPANAAAIVVRNADLAIRAYVGSGAYFSSQRAGMVDMARAVRSPGSVLKPVIYALAFEDLIVHPDTIVTDEPFRKFGYSPENFDRLYRGEITVRDALVHSVNTVPVRLLDQVGPDRFVGRLRHAGLNVKLPDTDSPPGLAVALGGMGIDLESLASLYAGLANRGDVRPLRYRPSDPLRDARPLVSEEAAWAVTDILADAVPPVGRSQPRARDGGRRIAAKTGTSYGFRDAWAVGFDGSHTAAVWVGRPDNAARLGDTAAETAMPLMFRIFDLLPTPAHDVAAERPPSGILARSDRLPPRLQRFPPVLMPQAQGWRQALSIEFPVDGSNVRLERRHGKVAPLVVVARGGLGPYRWFVDGERVAGTVVGARMNWNPPGMGQVEIRVLDSHGQQAAASVWLE